MTLRSMFLVVLMPCNKKGCHCSRSLIQWHSSFLEVDFTQ